MTDEDFDFTSGDLDICACGCYRNQHTVAGRCRYCSECEGWTYDEESTMLSYMGED